MKNISIDALKFDEHNFNKHTQRGTELLQKSVAENGFGRSILVDNQNNIIAGNGIVETARKLGKKNIRVIDTTGDELVVVRRTDLDIDSEEGRRMALADNATSALNLSWDYDELEKAKETWNVTPEDWGVTIESKEYREFVEKFDKEAEKTTDDCYTPQDVYECVRDYFTEQGILPKDAKIVRPFYPGGDFEREHYPEGCVVYDNPPFSILSRIVRFYVEKGIKFLLFCPTLTSIQYCRLCTIVVCDYAIRYANGAEVNTSFVTNLCDDDVAIKTLGGELKGLIKSLASQKSNSVKNVRRLCPDEFMAIKEIISLSRYGIKSEWSRKSLCYVNTAGNEAFVGGVFC